MEGYKNHSVAARELYCSDCGSSLNEKDAAMRSETGKRGCCRSCVLKSKDVCENNGEVDRKVMQAEIDRLKKENAFLRKDFHAKEGFYLAKIQMLGTEMEIVKRELNDVKENIKEKSEHEGLLSSLPSFPSLAEGKDEEKVGDVLLCFQVKPIMESHDEDERIKKLEKRVLNATNKEDENKKKLVDLGADSEHRQRDVARLGTVLANVKGIQRDILDGICTPLFEHEWASLQKASAKPD